MNEFHHRSINEYEKLNFSNDTAKHILDNGNSILLNLHNQNESIRHSNNQLYNIINVLKLSDSTIRYIQKQIHSNKKLIRIFIFIIAFIFITYGIKILVKKIFL